MRNIIVFGPMGSGKTTLAKIIHTKDHRYEMLSLASKFKTICREFGRSDRDIFQKIGQFFRKEFGENVWCEYLYNNVRLSGLVIVDDGRQHNEFEYFKEKGFLTVGIISDTMTRVERIFQRDGVMTTREQLSHETENQAKEVFEKCDIRIYNNASLDELREEAKKIIKILEEER